MSCLYMVPIGESRVKKECLLSLLMGLVQPKEEFSPWSLKYKYRAPFQWFWNQAGNFLDYFIEFPFPLNAQTIRNGHTTKSFLSFSVSSPHFLSHHYYSSHTQWYIFHYLLLPFFIQFYVGNLRSMKLPTSHHFPGKMFQWPVLIANFFLFSPTPEVSLQK